MPESKPKKPTSTVEPNRALRELARLLGRQAARQFFADKVMQDPASPGDQARNVLPTSNSSTEPT